MTPRIARILHQKNSFDPAAAFEDLAIADAGASAAGQQQTSDSGFIDADGGSGEEMEESSEVSSDGSLSCEDDGMSVHSDSDADMSDAEDASR